VKFEFFKSKSLIYPFLPFAENKLKQKIFNDFLSQKEDPSKSSSNLKLYLYFGHLLPLLFLFCFLLFGRI